MNSSCFKLLWRGCKGIDAMLTVAWRALIPCCNGTRGWSVEAVVKHSMINACPSVPKNNTFHLKQLLFIMVHYGTAFNNPVNHVASSSSYTQTLHAWVKSRCARFVAGYIASLSELDSQYYTSPGHQSLTSRKNGQRIHCTLKLIAWQLKNGWGRRPGRWKPAKIVNMGRTDTVAPGREPGQGQGWQRTALAYYMELSDCVIHHTIAIVLLE